MSKIKVGVIGIGNMGKSHSLKLDRGKVEGTVLSAVCDIREGRLNWAKENLSDGVLHYKDVEAFFMR